VYKSIVSPRLNRSLDRLFRLADNSCCRPFLKVTESAYVVPIRCSLPVAYKRGLNEISVNVDNPSALAFFVVLPAHYGDLHYVSYLPQTTHSWQSPGRLEAAVAIACPENIVKFWSTFFAAEEDC
jgi:hypothetical protein